VTETINRTEGPWRGVKQVAYYLGMSERAVRDLEYRGVLPGHRLGRSLKFSLPELDRLLLERRQCTLDELGGCETDLPTGLLGPLMSPDVATEYLGLPSARALIQRVYRMQMSAYYISRRIIRFRKCELDDCMLTSWSNGVSVNSDACLPELERR
jgi:excisionase family DNA binding protein